MARLQDNPPPPIRVFLVDDEPIVRDEAAEARRSRHAVLAITRQREQQRYLDALLSPPTPAPTPP